MLAARPIIVLLARPEFSCCITFKFCGNSSFRFYLFIFHFLTLLGNYKPSQMDCCPECLWVLLVHNRQVNDVNFMSIMFLFIYLFIYLFTYLFTYLFIYLFIIFYKSDFNNKLIYMYILFMFIPPPPLVKAYSCVHLCSSGLSLLLPRLPKIKIQDKSQISFCKILKYK